MSTWSTQYDSVLNKDIKIDEKKTHNGRGLVHYHPGIGETVDIRITPPVLRRSRPSTQQQPTFRRSGRSRHISPIQSLLPYKEPDLSTQEPPLLPRLSRPPVRSTPCTAVTLSYGVRSIQQSLFFYAAYSSRFYSVRSIQQSLFFYAAVAPSPPAAEVVRVEESDCCTRSTPYRGSAEAG